MVKKLVIVSALLALSLITGCESWARTMKDWDSNSGGLNRVMKVYDNQGHTLATYEGKFDIAPNTDNNGGTTGTKILFDLDGKRHIIYNAIVIVDEK